MGKLRPPGRGRAALISCCAVLATLLFAGAAHAVAIANTGEATMLTPTSAVLNGRVDASQERASWFFEYGTTTAYGQVTPAGHVGGGETSVSAPVAGLDPGTTYHFRLVVNQGLYSENNFGGDVTFTTLAEPESVATTGQATSVTATSAVLNGVTNSPQPGARWMFQYGTTTAYGHSTASHQVGGGLSVLSAKITGLTAGTRYHFRLVVTPPGSTAHANGGDASFRTARAFGQLTLRRHHLHVRHGKAAVPLMCSGVRGASCRGRVTLTTRIGTGRHARRVRCGNGKLRATAVAKVRVRVRLGRHCAALLASAPRHQLGARLRVLFAVHQRLSTGVRLFKR